MKGLSIIIIAAFGLQLLSCQSKKSSEFRDALTFYASFDSVAKADFAQGDANMYTATASYENGSRKLDDVQKGMKNADHGIVKGKGQFGDAFEFGKKSDSVLFYKSKDNIVHNAQNWSGTISFWLSMDPNTDIEGYTDPIQITDKSFNNASIWVDFTDKAPHDFRLGVFGDKNVWTQDTLNASPRDVFAKRLVSVKASTFRRSNWTHVLITYNSLGTEKSIASLYLNGEKQGSISGIDDPFNWELEQSNIFLGLNFSGLMDELAIFNVPLTDEQALKLYQLKDGIKSIL